MMPMCHHIILDGRRKMITRGDANVSDAQQLERELEEVKAVLSKHFLQIRATFMYYSCLGGLTGICRTV
jgi:hypothetical protein